MRDRKFIIIWGGVNLLDKHQEDCWLTEIPFYTESGGEESQNLFHASYTNNVYCKTGSLISGVYHVTVSYTTESELFSVYCNKDKDGYRYPAIYADNHELDPLKDELTFTMWVNEDIEDLEIYFCYEEEDTEEIQNGADLWIEHIALVRDYGKSVLYGMMRLLAIFLIFNIGMIVIWNWDIIKRNFWVIFGLGCIFTVISIGTINPFQCLGHDMRFHCARIAGLAEGIRTGNFPVRIQPGWNNGYGYPVSIYYGDVFLYIPAFCYLLQIPIVYAYKIYVLLVNLGRVLISYFCFKKISHDKLAGVTCSALYSLSINYILNLYLRAAVGEYTASIFFPLIILGLTEILQLEKDNRNKRGWLYLSVGMTGVIQTHVLSTEMVCVVMAIFMITMFPRLLNKYAIGALCKSVVMAIGLNVGFLIPFLDYSREDIKVYMDKTQYGIQNYGLSLYELFSLPTKGIGNHRGDIVDGIKSKMPQALGIPFIIIILVAIIFLVAYDNWEKNEKSKLFVALVFAGIACFMATCYFPWNFLAAIPGIQKMVSSIQFPWRFLTIAAPILSYAAAILFVQLKKCLVYKSYGMVLAVLCVICAIQGMYTMDLVLRNWESYVIYDGDVFLNRKDAVSGGEYLLTGSLGKFRIENNISGEGIEILDVERYGTTITLSCVADDDVYLEIPLFAYDYYRCIDLDTKITYPCVRGKENRINVMLPAGYEGRLKISFVEPWYWRAAELISVVTFMVLLWCLGFIDKLRAFLQRLFVVNKDIYAK